MLNKMSPFFAILCSMFFLREKRAPYQIGAVLTAFAGALFIIRPTFSNLELLPSLIGLLGGFAAGAALHCRAISGAAGRTGTFRGFLFSAFSCLFCLPFMIADYAPMSLYQLTMLLLAGLPPQEVSYHHLRLFLRPRR